MQGIAARMEALRAKAREDGTLDPRDTAAMAEAISLRAALLELDQADAHTREDLDWIASAAFGMRP